MEARASVRALIRRFGLPGAGWLLGTLAPARAAAAGASASASRGGLSIGQVLGFIVLAALATVLARLVVERLQRRLLVLAGGEYLLLGALMGAGGLGIAVFEELTPVLPGIALAAGWVGLQRGFELRLGEVVEMPAGAVRVALVHSVVTATLVAVGSFLALRGRVFGFAEEPLMAAAVAGFLAASAAADASAPYDLLANRYRLEGSLHEVLRHATRLGDVLVILGLGTVFCLFHKGRLSGGYSLRPAEWLVITGGLGVLLGLVFAGFLAGGGASKDRFLVLVGIVAFASGAAWLLRLDPLSVHLVLGFVLVHATRAARPLRETLRGVQRPMLLVLLVLAGALWRPVPWVHGLTALAGFVVLRLGGKVLGSSLAALGTDLRVDSFRGLLAHGEITVAMAVVFRLVYEGPAVDLAYSTVLGSVLLSDPLAPRVLRGLLLDAGELKERIASERALGIGEGA